MTTGLHWLRQETRGRLNDITAFQEISSRLPLERLLNDENS